MVLIMRTGLLGLLLGTGTLVAAKGRPTRRQFLLAAGATALGAGLCGCGTSGEGAAADRLRDGGTIPLNPTDGGKPHLSGDVWAPITGQTGLVFQGARVALASSYLSGSGLNRIPLVVNVGTDSSHLDGTVAKALFNDPAIIPHMPPGNSDPVKALDNIWQALVDGGYVTVNANNPATGMINRDNFNPSNYDKYQPAGFNEDLRLATFKILSSFYAIMPADPELGCFPGLVDVTPAAPDDPYRCSDKNYPDFLHCPNDPRQIDRFPKIYLGWVDFRAALVSTKLGDGTSTLWTQRATFLTQDMFQDVLAGTREATPLGVYCQGATNSKPLAIPLETVTTSDAFRLDAQVNLWIDARTYDGSLLYGTALRLSLAMAGNS